MTDIATTKADNEPFWTRVRIALTGARPMRPEREPDYRQAAMARSIGMKPKLGARIEEELVAAWGASADRRVSLSLLVIEIDRFKEYFTVYGKDETEDCLREAMQAIRDALPREGDSVFRLGRASFVVVLPDFPVLMARVSAQKITSAVRDLGLAHKESHAGVVTVGVGLAVSNPEGGYDKKFFETAAEALNKAHRRGLSRIETVDLRPAQERKRKAG